MNAFRGERSWLSNFAPLGRSGLTLEHYFAANKTLDAAWQAKILAAPTPGAAKRLGRAAPLRADWDAVKREVMLKLLRWKFSDPRFAALLEATGDEELVETNTWGDRYWGVCDGEGENWMGKTLMIVREENRHGF